MFNNYDFQKYVEEKFKEIEEKFKELNKLIDDKRIKENDWK